MTKCDLGESLSDECELFTKFVVRNSLGICFEATRENPNGAWTVPKNHKYLRNKFLGSPNPGCATKRSAISSLDLIGILNVKLPWDFACERWRNR